jgi:hypothetical protein
LIVSGADAGAQFAVCVVFQHADRVPGRVHGHAG